MKWNSLSTLFIVLYDLIRIKIISVFAKLIVSKTIDLACSRMSFSSYSTLFTIKKCDFFRRRGFQIEIKRLVFLKRDRNGMFSMILYSFGEV